MSESQALLGTLETVNIDRIYVDGDRRELNQSHVEELKKSILERGLIQPIALYHPPTIMGYKLLAGFHRYNACKQLGLPAINARVFDHELSQYELKAIELYENIHRKDLTGPELSQQTQRLHTLMQHMYGPPIPGKSVGHAMKDTARMLGKSIGSVHGDIKLANAIEQFPELGLDKIPNKITAMRVLQRFANTITNQEVAKNLKVSSSNDKATRLLASYRLGDFFSHNLPAETFSLIEIDPPYGVDLASVKQGLDRSRLNTYNEIDAGNYPEFLLRLLYNVYNLASTNAWVILWFAHQWYFICIDALRSTGFDVASVPAIWKKGNSPGQSNAPDSNLGNAYESFIYARKGSPKLHALGRSNVFDFAPLPEVRKIHPTERPLELMKEILYAFAMPHTAVLCPFLGSGNTILAAEQLNLPCIGYELSETYHNAFVSRINTQFNN